MRRWRCSRPEPAGPPQGRTAERAQREGRTINGAGRAALSGAVVLAAALVVGCTEAPTPAEAPAADRVSVAPGAEADTPPQRLTAIGHEPGWRLDLDAGRLSLLTDLGERRVEAPAPAPERRPEGWHYAARTATGTLAVTLSPRVCHNIATGMPHPLTVTVLDDGRRLDGCGGEPRTLLVGDWRVVEVGGQPVDAALALTMGFDADGRLSGQGPCGALGGSWVLGGEGLTLTPTVETAACPEPLHQLEARWLALLRGTYRFHIGDDGALGLVAADARVVARRP